MKLPQRKDEQEKFLGRLENNLMRVFGWKWMSQMFSTILNGYAGWPAWSLLSRVCFGIFVRLDVRYISHSSIRLPADDW